MSSSPPPAAPDSVPHEGLQPGAEHDALPAGTRFGELEIVRMIGAGGFGIVYLAHDHSLERDVALKEYMPASLARRGLGPQITVRSGAHAETYAVGLRSFINEARMLARFDHPSLVKVYRFWEANSTAYMVMPYLQGRTVREVRRSMTQSPSEGWMRVLLGSLLAAIEQLHREEIYHRDIAPDNILLPPDGPPVLLDFGAARRVISDRTQSLTAILKPNYAPIEQYAEMTQMRQGPWTDLYALGAVAHYLVFGKPPSPATARAVSDDLTGLAQRLVPGVSPRFLAIVGWMLAVRPQHRPQNVAELRAVLEGNSPVPAPVRDERPTVVRPARSEATQFPPTMRIDSPRPMAPPAPTQRPAATPLPAPPRGSALHVRPPPVDHSDDTVILPASQRRPMPVVSGTPAPSSAWRHSPPPGVLARVRGWFALRIDAIRHRGG